jgi:multidrug efflux pump subunit AcrB
VLSGIKTGEFREDDKSIPIMMRSDESQQQTFETIETLNLFSQSTGKSVPFLQVASIHPEWQYAKIKWGRQKFKREYGCCHYLFASFGIHHLYAFNYSI